MEDHNTKVALDEGVEKHSCQIELRGAHVKLVHYNNKPVLRAYIMLHVTTVLHVKSEDEHVDTYTYTLTSDRRCGPKIWTVWSVPVVGSSVNWAD
jgi:hypothetical protein